MAQWSGIWKQDGLTKAQKEVAVQAARNLGGPQQSRSVVISSVAEEAKIESQVVVTPQYVRPRKSKKPVEVKKKRS